MMIIEIQSIITLRQRTTGAKLAVVFSSSGAGPSSSAAFASSATFSGSVVSAAASSLGASSALSSSTAGGVNGVTSSSLMLI
jgi:hypothetical protein